MSELYRTGLELGLEVTLEQIGYPFGNRVYFGFPDEKEIELRKILTNAEKSQDLQFDTGLYGFKYGFLKNLLKLHNDNLIQRASSKNKNRFFVKYNISPLEKDKSLLEGLVGDERISFINKLIKNERYFCESIELFEGYNIATFMYIFRNEIDKIKLYQDLPFKLRRGECSELHGKPNINRILKEISDFMSK